MYRKMISITIRRIIFNFFLKNTMNGYVVYMFEILAVIGDIPV